MARRERVADCHDICFLPITDALCTLTRSSFRVATPSHTAPCRILLWVAQAHPFPSCHLWGGPHLRELTAIGLRDNTCYARKDRPGRPTPPFRHLAQGCTAAETPYLKQLASRVAIGPTLAREYHARACAYSLAAGLCIACRANTPRFLVARRARVIQHELQSRSVLRFPCLSQGVDRWSVFF